MRFLCVYQTKEQEEKKQKNWHKWFAWFPITINYDNYDDLLLDPIKCCLCFVERKKIVIGRLKIGSYQFNIYKWIYREIEIDDRSIE